MSYLKTSLAGTLKGNIDEEASKLVQLHAELNQIVWITASLDLSDKPAFLLQAWWNKWFGTDEARIRASQAIQACKDSLNYEPP